MKGIKGSTLRQLASRSFSKSVPHSKPPLSARNQRRLAAKAERRRQTARVKERSNDTDQS